MSRSCLAYAALGGSLTLFSPLLSGPALADPTADAVIVTASRLDQPLTQTPDAYVIDRDQIESRGAVFAADLLATVPGAIIGENGFGGTSSLSLRGASSDKTLVLIDGVPVNDPSQPQGSFDFSSLDLASTQRIEVLSGPQGALWGSDAIGGVVSITSLEPNGVAFAGEAGSLATYRETASAGVSTAPYAAGVSYAGFRTAGVPNADEKFGNTQPDGFNDTTISLNGRVDPNDKISLDGRVRYVHAAEEYDIFSNPAQVEDPTAGSVVQSETGYVRIRIKDVLGFDQELRADLMGIDRNYYGEFPFSARGDQEVLRWSATRQTRTWGLQAGAEHKREAENTGDGLVFRNDDGAFVIGRWTPDSRLDLTASVRQDQFQAYGGQTTARGGAAWRLGGGFTLLASAGQGFKAPSVYEITYLCLECTVVGPPKNLRPEQALGEDAALDWTSGDGATRARVTVFGLNIVNQIDYVYPIGYLNLSHVRTAGLEFSGEQQLGAGWSVRGSFAAIDGVDGTGPAQLLRVPRDSGSGSLSWKGQAWGAHGAQAEIGFRGQDQAQDYSGVLHPFMIAYARASLKLTAHLSLTARVENLANTHYEQAYGYGEPGRMVLAGLSWR
jgi:vitamin B12 transporter